MDLGRLMQVDADQYIKFDKLDMDPRIKDHLRNTVRMAAAYGGFDPKKPIPFEEIRKRSVALLGGSPRCSRTTSSSWRSRARSGRRPGWPTGSSANS